MTTMTATRGLPRSGADVIHAVRAALELRPELGDAGIAAHVGVDVALVAAERAAADSAGSAGRPAPVAARTGGLSRLQRRILAWLLSRQGEADPDWGVRWRPSHGESASRRASLSRALRRIEQRGLCRRLNQVGGPDSRRTTHVELTPKGIEAAKRLTNAKLSMLTVACHRGQKPANG